MIYDQTPRVQSSARFNTTLQRVLILELTSSGAGEKAAHGYPENLMRRPEEKTARWRKSPAGSEFAEAMNPRS
ncbi:MAG TPA: hypothetical protein VII12_13965 [Thermoanaerobaculia bacterium]|jgi:hypothetical protein